MNAVEQQRANATDESVLIVKRGANRQLRCEVKRADRARRFSHLALRGTINDKSRFLSVPLDAHRVPVVVVQRVARFDVHAQRPGARLVLELQLVTVNDRQLDEVGGALRVEQHGVLLRRFELEVDVAGVSHVEAGQRDGRVGDAECHHVVEEVIALAHQRAQRVLRLLLIQSRSGVAETQAAHRQIIFFLDFAAVLLPVVQVGIAVAPLGRIDAVADDSALALAGAWKGAGPVVHHLVLSRQPPAVRAEALLIGWRKKIVKSSTKNGNLRQLTRRVEQSSRPTVVRQALRALPGAIQKRLDLRHLRVVLNRLIIRARLLEAVDDRRVFRRMSKHRQDSSVRQKLAGDLEWIQRTRTVDVDLDESLLVHRLDVLVGLARQRIQSWNEKFVRKIRGRK